MALTSSVSLAAAKPASQQRRNRPKQAVRLGSDGLSRPASLGHYINTSAASGTSVGAANSGTHHFAGRLPV